MRTTTLIALLVGITAGMTLHAQGNKTIKVWQLKNGLSIEQLADGETSVILPNATVDGEYKTEASRKALAFDDADVALWSDKGITWHKRGENETYMLFYPADDIYRIDNKTQGIVMDNRCYAYTLPTNTAQAIAPQGNKVAGSEIQRFNRPYDKTKRYKIDKYVEKMTSYFKLLSTGNDKEGEKVRSEIIKMANKKAYGKETALYAPNNPFLQALYPIWNIAEALRTNNMTNNGINVNVHAIDWTAMELLSEVMKKGELLGETNDFLSNPYIGLSATGIGSRIENKFYRMVSKKNTEETYDQFLSLATDPQLVEQATIARERIAHERVATSSRIDEFQRYLDKYKDVNPEHYASIEKLRDQYAFEALDFTIDACKAYIARYPHSAYLPQVKDRLYKYAFNQLKPTATSCQSYIDNYPESPYYEEVRGFLYKYAMEELPDNATAYQDYVKKYPQSPYRSQVEQYLVKIAYQEAIDANTAELYNKFLEDYPDSGYTIEIKRRLSDLTGDATGITTNPNWDDKSYYETSKDINSKPAEKKKKK